MRVKDSVRGRAKFATKLLRASALLVIPLLSQCGGKESTDGSDGSNGGAAGMTSSSGGAAGVNGGKGGIGGGGLAGTAGISGMAGMGNYSFGGHTGSCIGNPCMPGCGFCSGTGGGGQTSQGGDTGVAGAGGVNDAKSLRDREAIRACYSVSAYQAGPCLPADDTLLSWIDNVPTSCDGHIVDGPYATAESDGMKSCCYAVKCASP